MQVFYENSDKKYTSLDTVPKLKIKILSSRSYKNNILVGISFQNFT